MHKLKIAFRSGGVPAVTIWLVDEIILALDPDKTEIYVKVIKDSKPIVLTKLAELAIDGNEIDLQGWWEKFLKVDSYKIR